MSAEGTTKFHYQGGTKHDLEEWAMRFVGKAAGKAALKTFLKKFATVLGDIFLFPTEANPLTPEEKRIKRQKQLK